jgi:dihydroorotate dehydrogenase (NAD+) catalytic subunit
MDTSVTIAAKTPLVLKNPILTASGTFGYGLEFMPYGDLKSLGGIVVKGLSLKPRTGNPLPRVAETACGMLNAVGLQNDGVEDFLNNKLPALPWRETPIIANLYAGSSEEFGELAAILSAHEGVAALEVNISCPNVREGGVLFGQNPAQAAAVTEAVKRRAAGLPVLVKLSPNVTDIAVIARAVENAGADALCCINTISGMAVDIHTRKPRLATILGGLSGPAIKPVALRCVWQARNAVKIPIIGIGGIVTVDDVLEFLLVGASAVQIGTANFIRPDAAFELAKEIGPALGQLGVKSIDEWRDTLNV